MSEHFEVLKNALDSTIGEIELPALGNKIKGKVRDCYVIGDKRVLISSDRLSAFDVILSTIPFKGKLLNDLSAFWFEKTGHIVKNHIVARPHPNIFIGQEVKIVPIEVVVREYLAGSSYRDYLAGRSISGITLPEGLRKSQKLAEPILTPSTKAAQGEHDMPISEGEILASKIVPEAIWVEIKQKALDLFKFASTEVAKRGLILVDTKFEFGIKNYEDGSSEVILADEIFTQDCSRYWIAKTYEERLSNNQDPEMLDKEFIRRWLMDRGYMGEGTPPKFTDSFRVEVAEKYIEVYEIITGLKFEASNLSISEEVVNNILKICA